MAERIAGCGARRGDEASGGLVSVAVGNTTTRTVLWRNRLPGAPAPEGRPLCTAETAALLSSSDDAALCQFVAMLSQHLRAEEGVTLVDVVIGGGSVPAVEAILHEALTRVGHPIGQVQLLHRRQQQGDDDESDERHRQGMVAELGLRVQPSPPWRVGKDRLCAALGALSLASQQPLGTGSSSDEGDTAWVVVDSGTALTINSVLPSPKSAWPEMGVFEGGLIMPGEGLMLRSLSSGTAQLPSLPYWPTSPPPLVGQSTEEAIRAGVRHLHLKGAVAVVKSVATELAQRRSVDGDRPLRVRVAVTGGGGQGLIEALEADAHEYQPLYDPLLVHRGLHTAWQLYRGTTRHSG